MCDAPPGRNIVIKKVYELLCGLYRIGVSPGTEGNKQFIILVKCQMPVHHSAYSYGFKGFYSDSILAFDICKKIRIAGLKTLKDFLLIIAP